MAKRNRTVFFSKKLALLAVANVPPLTFLAEYKQKNGFTVTNTRTRREHQQLGLNDPPENSIGILNTYHR